MKVFSQNALAELLERDRGTVGRALRKVRHDATEKGQPRWKLTTALKALDALPGSHGAAPSRRAEADNSPTLTEERTRFMRAKANDAERRDRAADGELVDIYEVAKLVGVDYSVVHDKVLGMAGKLQGLIGEELAIIVDTEAREILSELSDPDNLVRRAAYATAGLTDLHDEAVAVQKKPGNGDA
jgi:hypothetical protein